jgi:LysR family nod box-dependent transcriptional activator
MLRGLNHKRNVEVVTPSFDMAPQLVIGTDRIATVATRLARKYAKLLPINLLPVPIDIPPMIEVLQWHRAHDHDPAHQWLRAQLKHTVAQIFDEQETRRRGHRFRG